MSEVISAKKSIEIPFIAEPWFALSENFVILKANPPFQNLFGREALDGVSLQELCPDLSLQKCLSQMGPSDPFVLCEDFSAKLGRWFEYRARRAEWGFSVLCLDISTRKKSERTDELRRLEQALIAETSCVALAKLGLDGRWQTVNPKCCEILGRSAGELMRMSFRQICVDFDVEIEQQRAVQLMNGITTNLTTERKIRRPDDREVWVRVTHAVARDPAGRATGFTIAFHEIDDRKQIEESLGFALEAAQLGEFDYDAVADSTRRSERFNEIFGDSEFSGEWNYEQFLKHIAPSDRDHFADQFERALQKGGVFRLDFQICWPDESLHDVAFFGRVYLDERGCAVRVAGLVREVTTEKEAIRELSIAKLAAEDANREKSYFLANMSHEIRTPLGAILGFTEALKDENLGAREREKYLQILTRNGQNLAALIDDILDLSKVEAGQLQVELRATGVQELVDDVAALLTMKAAMKQLQLVITPSELPGKVMTDPTRLRQIMMNVIGNAIKFTDRGEVRVSVKQLEGEGQIAIYVRDTGIGISKDSVDRLFNPFSQADNSTTRKFGGTGLGLALSRRLARAMGGDVMLGESYEGKGSTFVILLPAHFSQEVAVTPSTIRLESKIEARPSFEVLPGLNILLADDSPDNQELISRMLRAKTESISLADNGQQAVDKVLKDDYDVVLMDMQMPELDGYEATRQLRAQGFRGPIVALTANAMRHDREKCLQAGCNEYVSKPVDPDKLFHAIGIALENTRH